MSLESLWFVVIAVFWTGFFVLEGFDFGVGMLHRALGRTDIERRVAINTIGPLWDGNEVWLIVGGAAIFAAFPDWYATWFSAGYLALFLVLIALIVRGISFEWRMRVEKAAWRSTWSWAMTVGSALIPLVLGVALGDLLAGLPIDAQAEFTGTFFDLFTPYGVWLGLTLLLACLVHGAIFLGLKTTGALHERAGRLAARLSWPTTVLVVVFAAWTFALSDGGFWRALAVVVPVAAIFAVHLALGSHRELGSFAATSVMIGGLVAALFANLYPNVMVSSSGSANTLTVAGAASGHYALTVMTVVAVVLVPFVLLYQGWSYWVFRARIVTPSEEEQATTGSAAR